MLSKAYFPLKYLNEGAHYAEKNAKIMQKNIFPDQKVFVKRLPNRRNLFGLVIVLRWDNHKFQI